MSRTEILEAFLNGVLITMAWTIAWEKETLLIKMASVIATVKHAPLDLTVVATATALANEVKVFTSWFASPFLGLAGGSDPIARLSTQLLAKAETGLSMEAEIPWMALVASFFVTIFKSYVQQYIDAHIHRTALWMTARTGRPGPLDLLVIPVINTCPRCFGPLNLSIFEIAGLEDVVCLNCIYRQARGSLLLPITAVLATSVSSFMTVTFYIRIAGRYFVFCLAFACISKSVPALQASLAPVIFGLFLAMASISLITWFGWVCQLPYLETMPVYAWILLLLSLTSDITCNAIYAIVLLGCVMWTCSISAASIFVLVGLICLVLWTKIHTDNRWRRHVRWLEEQFREQRRQEQDLALQYDVRNLVARSFVSTVGWYAGFVGGPPVAFAIFVGVVGQVVKVSSGSYSENALMECANVDLGVDLVDIIMGWMLDISTAASD